MTENHRDSDIVLVGGGHAHVHVMAAFGANPEPGVRVTLVSRDVLTPYSGMLPGVLAGIYRTAEAHIDLRRLAAATGIGFVQAEAIGLDRTSKRVLLADRTPLHYSVVSFDVGITPALATIPGAAEHAIAVKPIATFMAKFENLTRRCRQPDGPRRIIVVGGGAGGVELMLAIRTRLLADATPAAASDFNFVIVTDAEILATHNRAVRAAFRRILGEKRISVHEHQRVAKIEPDAVTTSDGTRLAADAVLMTTDAAAPPLFLSSGLVLDAGGFLRVGPTLQSVNDPDVFAAGDCAALSEPREKAGVYAVRAGPPLSNNLRRRVRGEMPQPWRPQRHYLALISAGERYAVASNAWFKAEGRWVWTFKDWVDRRWIRQYQNFDEHR